MLVRVSYSNVPDSAQAGRQAAVDALRQAGRSDPCDFVLLFCTARHSQSQLRAAVSEVVGASVPIYGGGAVGVITNRDFGYAGDQMGLACVWLDGVDCHIMAEPGLLNSEEDTGLRLGKRLAQAGATPDTPMVLFYDAVDRTGGDVKLLMATWLLAGLEQGLDFLPHLAGAGLQGDHVCTPSKLYVGDGAAHHQALALAFSDEIQMDIAIMHGCRPASGYYTVTKSEGPVVLEINGEPAIPFLDRLLGPAIRPQDYPFFLILGVNQGDRWGEYDEDNYASRLCLGLDLERNGIVMFEPDLVAGTEFQIMYRSLELDYMRPKINALFDGLEGREPVFGLYIDCAGRCAGYGGNDMEDAPVLQQTVAGRVPLLGLYTGVEIAPMGGRARGLDWTGVFCLFSRRRPGDAACPDRSMDTWESREKRDSGTQAPIEAALQLCESNAAKILSLDAQSIAIRHELELKRRGFSLLAELSVSLQRAEDYESQFVLVARRINAALNMQKTAVLVPAGEGLYSPVVLQGFDEEERAALEHTPLRLPAELLEPERLALVTAEDESSRFAQLREALGLPYFISCPVAVQGQVQAILLTGRMAEQTPFLSRLGPGDVETVQAIGALMASALVRKHLDDAEERNRVMLDATPLCANFWNESGNNIDCNLEAVKLFELSGKQEYIERFHELSPEFQPDGRRSEEASREMIELAFRQGHCVFEWMHQKLNGELIPSEITLERVRYKGGHVVIGYTRDLRELKATLAAMERTQEELRSARDAAEESSQAKSIFLANMSHEIRTPMNAIIGMTEMAKGNRSMEHVQYCLGKIEDASSHLLGIINDVLDMSKIGSGKFSLSCTDFTVEDMLKKVTDIVNFRVDEKQQQFIITVDRDVPQAIVSDRQRLTQVITNLLSNAVKFTPEGGQVGLQVQKQADEGEDCLLLFKVTDNGIGISEEQQARLFGSFEQADGSISRRFGGTGLGLAISKSIVELMEGDIWVESQPGRGSVFSFTARVKKGTAKPWVRLSPRVDWSNIRVLVVDDAPEVLEYFQNVTEGMGLTCHTAGGAREALALLEQDAAYDILFVDWRMPDMDGIAFTRQVRARFGGQTVVVMISATAWSQIEEQATAAGVNRFLAKPLLPSPIVDCINECVGGTTAEEGREAPADTGTEGMFAGRRILLAEDIEINREILIALLEGTGLAIDQAENGLVACQLFEQHPDRYDAILMDIHMPEQDGYSATRTIRAMATPRAKTVPIIAMTANVFREDIEACLAAGMDDHVGKPLDIDAVISTLERHLLPGGDKENR